MARDWRAAGERIAIERARRWPNRVDFAVATGLSVRVLEDLEGGRPKNYAPDTLAAVEIALRWEPGSVYRIADGLAPRYEMGPQLRAIFDAWPALSDEVRSILALIAEQYGKSTL